MKLVLFLGAGVSLHSGLLSAAKLTDELFKPRPDDDAATVRVRALLKVIWKFDKYDLKRVGTFSTGKGFASSGAIYRAGVSTYEDLFYLCEEISLWNVGLSDSALTTPFMERIAKRAGALLDGKSAKARVWNLGRFGRHGCEFIETVVTKTLEAHNPKGFDLIGQIVASPDVEQLSIVTLNHDTLVEQYLSANGIAFVDGFGAPDRDVRWSDDAVYDDPTARVRLLKLHGSIDWFTFRRDGKLLTGLLGTDLAAARDAAGRRLELEYARASLLSGLNKTVWYHRGIFAELHFRFAQCLRASDRMLMSGYGGGDDAINFELEAWLDRSASNRLMVLHRDPTQITNSSMILDTRFRDWTKTGQVVCTTKWLSEASMAEVNELVAT